MRKAGFVILSAAKNLSRPAPSPGCRKVLAAVLLAITAVWAAAMLASLHWRFLDRLVAFSDIFGSDFFQTPRAFRNLLAGNNIFLTELSDYGDPRSTVFFNHPFLAVAAGSWTAPWSPWLAYGIFACLSVGLLFLGAWCLASIFDDPLGKAFCYFAMLCSRPVYLVLWNGQMEIFVALGLALVLAGLMCLENEGGGERETGSGGRRSPRFATGCIQLGLLISLLSKPVVALILPVLFFLPETRRKLLLPVALYAAVSLLFLLVPRLNPGGYNGIHWFHIPNAVFKTQAVITLVEPTERDLANTHAIYCLPLLFNAWGAGKLGLLLARMPLAVAVLMSVAPLFLPSAANASAPRPSSPRWPSSPTICPICRAGSTTTWCWRRCCPSYSGFGEVKVHPGSAAS